LYLDGRPVQIKGATWTGLETKEAKLHEPPAASKKGVDDVLKELQDARFNALRLPVSLQYMLTADAAQLTTLRGFLEKAAARGFLVVFALSALQPGKPIDLWHDDKFTEADTVKGWTRLLKEVVLANPNIQSTHGTTNNVMGIDLLDRPGPSATWGLLKAKTDWNLFANRLIHTLDRDVPEFDGLFFVQGLLNEARESALE
jgi:aryl-phospho-beta-D-glucosidase BglC (GH1 family)